MYKHLKKYPCIPVLFILVLSTVPAFPQQDRGTRTPAWLQLSFEQRTRYEHLTNPFRPNTSGTEKHFPLRTRLKLEIGEAGHPVGFLAEFQDSRVLYEKENLFSARANINELDFLQAHLQFNLDHHQSNGMKSRIVLGRFTMDLGKRRLVARNNMRNTTNAFDGVSWTLAGDRDWTIRFFLTRPVTIDPYRLDSGSRRYFWGTYFESTLFHGLMLEAYYLGFRDTEIPASRQMHSTIGGRLYKLPAPGSMDYEMESAWQLGENGTRSHFAHFQHGELGFSFDLSWKPRISFHYDYASGDSDPEDDTSDRFNSLYGARSFEYTPTGIYGPIYRSNINAPGFTIALNPSDTLWLTTSYRAFWLADGKDAWTGSGLADPSGESGKSLGQNLEVRIRWRANRYITAESGYARFFKGSYLYRVPDGSRAGDSDYFYIATEVKAKLLPY
ncbi:MAG: alginate export family protein [Acidobacteria bacterium]|nr:alginate export family protein [Acidobacteriota bacterium]